MSWILAIPLALSVVAQQPEDPVSIYETVLRAVQERVPQRTVFLHERVLSLEGGSLPVEYVRQFLRLGVIGGTCGSAARPDSQECPVTGNNAVVFLGEIHQTQVERAEIDTRLIIRDERGRRVERNIRYSVDRQDGLWRVVSYSYTRMT